jgi:hypothetical protein
MKPKLAHRQKIKRRLDRAAKLITEARNLARETYPEAYAFCEGSGRIHILPDYNTRSEGVLVMSEQGSFDAGGW